MSDLDQLIKAAGEANAVVDALLCRVEWHRAEIDRIEASPELTQAYINARDARTALKRAIEARMVELAKGA